MDSKGKVQQKGKKFLKKKLQQNSKKSLKKKSKGKITKLQIVKKSKHQKMMEKRLKEWNSSSNCKLSIESIIHPLVQNNGYAKGCFLTLRQYQSDNVKKSKTDDMLILDNSNMDAFINHLTDAKEKMSKHMENIVIDEWDIRSEQSKYRRELSEINA